MVRSSEITNKDDSFVNSVNSVPLSRQQVGMICNRLLATAGCQEREHAKVELLLVMLANANEEITRLNKRIADLCVEINI